MKSKLAVLTAFLLTSSSFAQDARPSRDVPKPQPEMAEWTRSLAEKEAREGRDAAARGAAASYGHLEIITLAEMDAPAAVKENVAEGIRKRSKGTLEVAAGAIPSTAELIAGLSNVRRSESELKQRLSYAPADISRTPIAAAELLSTEPYGTIHGSKSTGVSRTYRVPKVGVIILSEDDYIASGTKLTLIRETLNKDVNGTPARSYSARSADGRGKAELRWVTPDRSYFLTLITDDGSRIEQGEELLLQVASSLRI